ncbi:MAG: 50S ribosomal protein L24 [Candidatus Omnitrophica bacterium]|nr:50S ribosomal protein L24 [Candidatus Omnitrophota bacterium]
MLRIKKNDIVKVLAGKDKGKTGKVITVIADKNRVIVQGINFNKKHAKKRRQDQQGGIIQKEGPLDMSNVAVMCKKCNLATKIGVDILQDGSKIRFCKKCKETIE